MDSYTQQKLSVVAGARRAKPLSHPATQELLAFGRAQGWDVAVLGRAPMPIEPVRVGEWMITPAHLDSSRIPARTWERVQRIYRSGLRPQGFVMVHEAPKLLAGPSRQEGTAPRARFTVSPEVRSKLRAAGSAVATAGVSVAAGLAVLGVIAAAGASLVVGIMTLAVGAALLDPILIAVTEDGYWVEIDRWYTE